MAVRTSGGRRRCASPWSAPTACRGPGGVQGQVLGLARAWPGGATRSPCAPRSTGPRTCPTGVAGSSTPGGRRRCRANGSVAPVALSPRRARPCGSRRVRDVAFDVVHVHEPFAPGLPYALLVGRRRPPLVGTFHRSGGSAFYTLLGAADPAAGPPAGRALCGVRGGGGHGPAAPWAAQFEVLLQRRGGRPVRGRRPLADRRSDRAVPRPPRGAQGPRPSCCDAWRAVAADRSGRRPGPGAVGGRATARQTEPLRARHPESADRALARGARPRRRRSAGWSAADVLVAPSLGGESFGLVLVEAMAARHRGGGQRHRRLPPGGRGPRAVLVPPGDPEALADALRRCARRHPGHRPTATGRATGWTRAPPGPPAGRWRPWPSGTRSATGRPWSGPGPERPYTARTMTTPPERPGSSGALRGVGRRPAAPPAPAARARPPGAGPVVGSATAGGGGVAAGAGARAVGSGRSGGRGRPARVAAGRRRAGRQTRSVASSARRRAVGDRPARAATGRGRAARPGRRAAGRTAEAAAAGTGGHPGRPQPPSWPRRPRAIRQPAQGPAAEPGARAVSWASWRPSSWRRSGCRSWPCVVLVVVTLGVAAVVWSHGAVPGARLASGRHRAPRPTTPGCTTWSTASAPPWGSTAPAIAVVDSDVPNALAARARPEVGHPGRDQRARAVARPGGAGGRARPRTGPHQAQRHRAVGRGRGRGPARGAWCGALRSAAETVHGLVGRGREFSADQRAALVVRYPTGIGSALGAMAAAPPTGARGWPPAPGRTAALTRWLWVDPMAGRRAGRVARGQPRRHPGAGRRPGARLTSRLGRPPGCEVSRPGRRPRSSSRVARDAVRQVLLEGVVAQAAEQVGQLGLLLGG